MGQGTLVGSKIILIVEDEARVCFGLVDASRRPAGACSTPTMAKRLSPFCQNRWMAGSLCARPFLSDRLVRVSSNVVMRRKEMPKHAILLSKPLDQHQFTAPASKTDVSTM